MANVKKNYVYVCLFQICSLLRGGIAERGGVRVGHRIIEINGQSVVAVPHERIVNLLATSIGEVMFHTQASKVTTPFRMFSLGMVHLEHWHVTAKYCVQTHSYARQFIDYQF